MKVLSFGLAVLLFLYAVGCGSGSSRQGGGEIPGVNIQVTSPAGAAAVDSGLTLPIAVTVTHDGGNAGVIWTVAPQHKGDPAGTLSDITPTTVTYNPPGNLTAPLQVTVTATSVADSTRSAAISISVYPVVSISTQPSDLATAFLNTDYTCIQTPITNAGVVQIPCQVNVTGGLAPFTWTVDLSSIPPGLLLSPGVTANDTKFVGKPTQAGVYPFSITVKDSLGGTAVSSFNINVAPGQLNVITPTLITTAAGVPYSPVMLQATGGVPPYNWTLAAGSGPLPDGIKLSPLGVISGTPSSNATFSFALRVADSQSPVPAQAIYPSPSPSNAKIITMAGSGLDPNCLPGGNSIASGTPYAFLLTGFDGDGPVTISGSFTADSAGNLTGVEDVIRKSGAQTNVPLTSGSSILFNPVGRGCLTLTTASSSAQFRVAPTTIAEGTGSAFFPGGRIMEFDDSDGIGTRASGFFRIQDPTSFSLASLAPSFAFRFSGWDGSGGHFAMAGASTLNDGMFTSVSADVNRAGVASGALNGGNGSLAVPDANGRGTATIGIGTATYDLVYYLVDSDHIVFNSMQAASAGHPLITGEATATAGPFSQASLADSHIFRLSGHTPGSPDVAIGVIHFDGAGTLSGNLFERSGASSVTPLSGAYAIDSTTGQFTFSGAGVPAVGYLVSGGNGVTGYLVGSGPSAASGVMEFQTNSYPPGYQFSPVNGHYGFSVDEILDPQTSVFAGQESLDPNGGITPDSYVDVNRPAPPGLIPSQTFTLFRYTWNAEGTGTFGANTYMVSNGDKVFYLDTSPANGHPAVIVGQRQQKP